MLKTQNKEVGPEFKRRLYFKSGDAYYPFTNMCGKDLREYSILERLDIVRVLPSDRNFDVSYRNAPSTTLQQLQNTLIQTYVVPRRIN